MESLLDAVGSTSSSAVSAAFFVALAYWRDATMVAFFLGAVANGVLGKAAKIVLGQPRPDGSTSSTREEVLTDNGMPSSHAMSLGFIGTFTVLHLPSTFVPVLLYGCTSLAYRVRRGFHTVAQVLAGAVLGSFNGWAFASLCDGTNATFGGVDVVGWVSLHLMGADGRLPWPGLAVPAAAWAAIAGSWDRRAARYWKERRRGDDKVE